MLPAQDQKLSEAAAAGEIGERVSFAVRVANTIEAGRPGHAAGAICALELKVNKLHLLGASPVVVKDVEGGFGIGNQHGAGAGGEGTEHKDSTYNRQELKLGDGVTQK